MEDVLLGFGFTLLDKVGFIWRVDKLKGGIIETLLLG